MTDTRIQHLVVLMMENHSYDNLLGFHQGELTGKETQPTECSATHGVVTVSDDAVDHIPLSPGHSLGDVNQQLFCTPLPAPGATATMDGFVANFDAVIKANHPTSPPASHADVMRCYGDKSPVRPEALWTLADTFTVLNRWFSAVPGPTTPNRLFANCASSAGYAGDAYLVGSLPASLAPLPSIFGSLTAAGKTWAVHYETDDLATELVLDDVSQNPGQVHCDPGFTKFLEAAAACALPNYTFLTPSLWTNSQHPPVSITPGDDLIKAVFNALLTSQCWEQTMLLVTYDEHGGYWDHVMPPSGMPYDGREWNAASPHDFGFAGPTFDFTRWGLRVPAIVASAYTPHQTDARTFEHSSIPHTVRDLFGLGAPLSVRDELSTSFADLASLPQTRTDLKPIP